MKLLKTSIFLYQYLKLIVNNYFISFHIVCEKSHDTARAGTDSFGLFRGREPVIEVSASFHSCHLSKRLQTLIPQPNQS